MLYRTGYVVSVKMCTLGMQVKFQKPILVLMSCQHCLTDHSPYCMCTVDWLQIQLKQLRWWVDSGASVKSCQIISTVSRPHMMCVCDGWRPNTDILTFSWFVFSGVSWTCLQHFICNTRRRIHVFSCKCLPETSYWWHRVYKIRFRIRFIVQLDGQ